MYFTEKWVGFSVQKFGKFVRAAVYPYGRPFRRKTTSRKKLAFPLVFGLRGENILIRRNLVCSLLKRLRFLILELHFEIVFQKFWIFSSLSLFQFELLPYLAQKFRHSRQKCILRVQKNIRWKIGFRLENVTVFHKQLEFTQKLVGLFVKKFSTFVRAAFYLPGGSFWGKTTSRKN